MSLKTGGMASRVLGLPRGTSLPDSNTEAGRSNDALEILLRFAAAMLGAGGTAAQARRWMDAMAYQMGFDTLSVSLTLTSVVASARRGGEQVTMMREAGPPGINHRGSVPWSSLHKR